MPRVFQLGWLGRGFPVVAVGVLGWTPSALAQEPADPRSAPNPLPAPSWGELRVPERPVWDVPVWHSLGLMTSLRITEAYLWPEPFAETRWSVVGPHYEEAFTRPPKWDSSQAPFEWDGDRWQINVIGHAALGAELYFRPRACGHGVWVALGQATAGALVWDYLFEASGVRPSGLDLWYTPLAGAVLGELRFLGYRASQNLASPALRAVLQGLFDPMGQIERAIGAPC